LPVVGFGVAFVSMAFPGHDFLFEGLLIADAAASGPAGGLTWPWRTKPVKLLVTVN
jgi:hypothetical protein